MEANYQWHTEKEDSHMVFWSKYHVGRFQDEKEKPWALEGEGVYDLVEVGLKT